MVQPDIMTQKVAAANFVKPDTGYVAPTAKPDTGYDVAPTPSTSSAQACERDACSTEPSFMSTASECSGSSAFDVGIPPDAVEVAVSNASSAKNEDTWDVGGPVCIGDDVLYFAAVFDGHGGKRAADLCRDRLVSYVLDAAGGDSSGESLCAAGEAAFRRAHAEVRAMDDGSVNDGTTATIVIANTTRRELTTLNSGDSSAMLILSNSNSPDPPTARDPSPAKASPKTSPLLGLMRRRLTRQPAYGKVMLTECHRLQTNVDERKRCERMGAQLAHARNAEGIPAGPLRLWPGGVAQARAIGDADCDDFIEPTPATSTVPLPQGKAWSVVVASDGVWDVLPQAAVARTVQSLRHETVTKVCSALIETAVACSHRVDAKSGRKVPKDDATVCVLRSFGGGEEESVPSTPEASPASLRPGSVCESSGDPSGPYP